MRYPCACSLLLGVLLAGVTAFNGHTCCPYPATHAMTDREERFMQVIEKRVSEGRLTVFGLEDILFQDLVEGMGEVAGPPYAIVDSSEKDNTDLTWSAWRPAL